MFIHIKGGFELFVDDGGVGIGYCLGDTYHKVENRNSLGQRNHQDYHQKSGKKVFWFSLTLLTSTQIFMTLLAFCKKFYLEYEMIITSVFSWKSLQVLISQ